MRFKRGSKVEVFSLKDVPFGSWQCAQIICGNGHYYTVKYDGRLGACNETLERVPRKSIRPSPPPLEGSEIWVPGDVVEIFHWFSWKMATIVKVLLRNRYLVRILGSSLEFKVSKFDMRARLCWQDGDWVLIGKGYDISEDQRHNVPLTLRYDKNSGLLTVSRHLKDDCLATTRNTGSIQESRAIPSRTLKRRLPFSNSEIESYAGPSQRFRVNEKVSMHEQFISRQQSLLPEQVDAVASSQKRLGEKCMHPSFKNRIPGYRKMILERKNIEGAIGCSPALSLKSRYPDCDSSSVGSCSTCRNCPYELPHTFSTNLFEDNDNQCSDAESFCQLESG